MTVVLFIVGVLLGGFITRWYILNGHFSGSLVMNYRLESENIMQLELSRDVNEVAKEKYIVLNVITRK